jgi:hypothetical protein
MLKSLAAWRNDPDLAGLREPEALDQLLSEEREECRALWSDIEAVLGPAPLSK